MLSGYSWSKRGQVDTDDYVVVGTVLPGDSHDLSALTLSWGWRTLATTRDPCICAVLILDMPGFFFPTGFLSLSPLAGPFGVRRCFVLWPLDALHRFLTELSNALCQRVQRPGVCGGTSGRLRSTQVVPLCLFWRD